MTKALVLLSGGLDSMLSARILMEQGIEVTGLSFKSNFFGTAKAKKVAGELGIKLIEIDFSAEHFAMVKNPKHGYGKNMNPCIDCHAMMLKKAREIMDNPPSSPFPPERLASSSRAGIKVAVKVKSPQPPFVKGGKSHSTPSNSPLSGGGKNSFCQGGEKYDFVATGEVLGERPMSQNAAALKTVEKESGLTGRLIRPLSAKLLAESDLEKSGKVNRNKLLDISGRSRKRQLALVKEYGIKEYASPGGGCLLTDPVFSEKLMKMFEFWPDGDGLDTELLKYGRIFWLKDEDEKNILLVIGRDEKDNEQLEKLARLGDVLIKFDYLVAGPTGLVRGIRNYESGIVDETREVEVPEELKLSELKLSESKSKEEIMNIALRLAGYYAVKERGKKVKLKLRSNK